MSKPAEAYPLYWPEGRRRSAYRERAGLHRDRLNTAGDPMSHAAPTTTQEEQ